MKKVNLLLVDDEADFRDATAKALTRRGFQVFEAESGERALEIIAETELDCVILDLRMAGISGIDTLAEIRRFSKQLPVIILTGHGALDNAMAGIRLGIGDFMQKPVDIDYLAARVRKLLNGEKKVKLKERRIEDLIVPGSSYRRVYEDQTIREVVAVLKETLFPAMIGDLTEQGHRTVLVYDRKERFVGVVRLNDILRVVLPSALLQSPYSSYLTGMFVAQCKLVGNRIVKDFVDLHPTIGIQAPLMEALYVIVTEKIINLPVLDKNGDLVGLLRDKDLLLEISNSIVWEGQ